MLNFKDITAFLAIVNSIIPSQVLQHLLDFYCFVTNYHKFSGFKQLTFIISVSVGQKLESITYLGPLVWTSQGWN